MNDNLSFTIISLGCSKNQVDSEIMISSLEKSGINFVNSCDDADIIIINTCGFISKAKEESIDTTLQAKDQFPEKTVIMAGCLNQRYKESLQSLMPEIDGFYETKDPANIKELVKKLIKDKKLKSKFKSTEKKSTETKFEQRNRLLSFPSSAYIKIADGCNNNCTYCSIPLIKGELNSRNSRSIIDEIKQLRENNIFEFNIIAQDIGSFGIDTDPYNESLALLLKDISKLNGDFWIRLLYIHPDHFPKEIIDIIKNDSRILPYFDIPFQHGSANILKAMGRKSDVSLNLELISRIRETLPDSIIRSTFLIGFPGEDENDFNDLLEFQKKANFEWLGSFTYSREEDTKAYSLKNRVKKSTMIERKKKVEQEQVKITEKRLLRFTGRKLHVLIEEPVKGEGLYLARGYLNAPEVDGLIVVKTINEELLKPGDIVNVKIEKLNGIDLEAVITK